MISVICADDDKFFRAIYQKIFTTEKYQVRLFDRGDLVQDAHRKDPADILVLDINMPGKSGLQLCKELRKDPDNYDIPIVLVSGQQTEEEIVTALMAGADDYIVKPAQAAEILAKVTAVLRKRKITISNEMGLPPGTLWIGKYEIISQIGSGGFSRVYHAKDVTVTPHLETALKLFQLPPSKNKHKFVPPFLREAYGLSRLDHPNIIKLYDFGIADPYYYLGMEYLEGETLEDIVDNIGPLPEDEAVIIFRELIDTLIYLDAVKFMHRDIKPDNMMIDSNGNVKLLDFGTARHLNDETVAGGDLFLGTPMYAAPEIIKGERDVDMKADIYSVGATMFYIVTGAKPFSGKDAAAIFKNRLTEHPRPVRDVNASLRKSFAELIDSMLIEDPDDRISLNALDIELKRLESEYDLS